MATAESEAATANFLVHATWAARRAKDARVDSTPSLTIVDSGLDSDPFNIVCAARLRESDVGRAAKEVRDRFAARSRPFSWWVAPGDRPPDLVPRLLQAGLLKAESALAMALYLGPPGDPGRVRSRDGRLEVRQARTVAELGDFARINAENWTPPDADVELFYARSAAELLAPECPQRFFVAYRDGEALAAVEVTLAAGVAGVYNLSTRSSHRRRGIATVLLERTLWNAAESGVLTAVLQAAAAGVGLYRRLGFREFGVITELKSGQIQSVR